MAEKRRNNLNFLLLVCAIIGAALFYGCGGVGSDAVPKTICVVTGTVEGSNEIAASVRGASVIAGADVWIESDYENRVKTDAAGKFTLTTVPGNHRIVASYKSGTTVYKNRTAAFSVEKGRPETVSPDLSLIKAEQVIMGKLYDLNGNEVAGSSLITATVWGEPVTFNADGTFVTPPLPSTKTVETLLVAGGGFQTAEIPLLFNKNTPFIEYKLAKNSDVNRAPYATIAVQNDKFNPGKRTTIVLEGTMEDLDKNLATYSWTVTPACGTFTRIIHDIALTEGKSKSTAHWTSPDFDTVATISFSVTDLEGLTSSGKLAITVGTGKPNNNPVVTSMVADSGVFNGRQLYTFTANASDLDGDVLKYSWSASAGEFTSDNASTTNTISWRAPSVESGNQLATMTVSVSDGKAATAYSLQLTIQQNPPNIKPTINSYNITVASTNDLPAGYKGYANGLAPDGYYHIITYSNVNLTVETADTENDTIFYIWNAPGQLSAQSKKSCGWTLPAVITDTFATVTVTVYDSYSIANPIYATMSVKIHADASRVGSPVITFATHEAKISATGEITVYGAVTDMNSNPNSISGYVWHRSEDGGSTYEYVYSGGATLVDGSYTNIASMTFANLNPGTHRVSLTVTDANGLIASNTTDFDVNYAPAVALTATTVTSPNVVNPGENITFTATVTDADDTNFTYYWQFKENPIVSETGTSPKSRTVTPALLELPFGNSNVSVAVMDDFGEVSATETATVYYNNQPVINAIEMTPPLPNEGRSAYLLSETTAFSVNTSDVEDKDNTIGKTKGSVEWAYSKNSAAYVTFGGNTWQESLAFNAPGAGNYKIRARITDSQNGTAELITDTFVVAPAQTLTITPTPSVPADPTAAGNKNPKVVTLGTSFDLASAYSGSALKDIFWEQKKDGTTSFSSLTVTRDSETDLDATCSSLTNPGTYSIRVTATGANDEKITTDGTYKVCINSKPVINTLDVSPLLPLGRQAYMVGNDNNLTFSVDTSDSEDGNNKIGSSGIGSINYFYSTNGGTTYTPLPSNPYTFPANDYKISVIITDSMGAKASETMDIVVANVPTVTYKALAGYNPTLLSNSETEGYRLCVNVTGMSDKSEIQEVKWELKNHSSPAPAFSQISGVDQSVDTDPAGGFDLLYYFNKITTSATYTIRVTVTGEAGVNGSATHNLHINQTPSLNSISATPEQTRYTPSDTITFTAKAVDNDLYDKLKFEWRIDNGPVTTHTNDSLEATKYDTFVVDCAGFANKAYDIKCKVVDTIGSWSESVYSITVTDNINVSFNPSVGSTNPTYRLTTNAAPFPLATTVANRTPAQIKTVLWQSSLNGGSYSTLSGTPAITASGGAASNVTFDCSPITGPGTYTIRTTVTGIYDETASATHVLWVNQPPTINSLSATPSKTRYDSGEALTITASVQDNDAYDEIEFKWEKCYNNATATVRTQSNGAVTTVKTDALVIPTITTLSPGTTVFTCTAKDTGGETVKSSIEVFVNTLPTIDGVTITPAPSLTYNTLPVYVTGTSQTLTFGLDNALDPELANVFPNEDVRWKVGESAETTGQEFVNSFTSPGNERVTVTLYDSFDATCTASATFYIWQYADVETVAGIVDIFGREDHVYFQKTDSIKQYALVPGGGTYFNYIASFATEATVLGGAVKENGNVIVYKESIREYTGNDTGVTEISNLATTTTTLKSLAYPIYDQTVAYAIDVNGALITFRTSDAVTTARKTYGSAAKKVKTADTSYGNVFVAVPDQNKVYVYDEGLTEKSGFTVTSPVDMATAEDHLFVLSVDAVTQSVHIFSKNGTLKTSVNMGLTASAKAIHYHDGNIIVLDGTTLKILRLGFPVGATKW